MKNLIKYIILSSLRNRIYTGIFICLAIAYGISIILGNTNLIEQNQTSIIYASFSSRIILIFGIILFVCINIGNIFNNKEIDFILTKSISRQEFIISYLIGFFLASLIILLFIASVLLFLFKVDLLSLFFWLLTICAELMIIISFSLLSSLILKNQFNAILSTVAFYILSRMMSIFTFSFSFSNDLAIAKNHLGNFILKIISLFFPRLDLFGQSQWLIYKIENYDNFRIIATQTIIYIALMIVMSFYDFKNKEF